MHRSREFIVILGFACSFLVLLFNFSGPCFRAIRLSCNCYRIRVKHVCETSILYLESIIIIHYAAVSFIIVHNRAYGFFSCVFVLRLRRMFFQKDFYRFCTYEGGGFMENCLWCFMNQKEVVLEFFLGSAAAVHSARKI